MWALRHGTHKHRIVARGQAGDAGKANAMPPAQGVPRGCANHKGCRHARPLGYIVHRHTHSQGHLLHGGIARRHAALGVSPHTGPRPSLATDRTCRSRRAGTPLATRSGKNSLCATAGRRVGCTAHIVKAIQSQHERECRGRTHVPTSPVYACFHPCTPACLPCPPPSITHASARPCSPARHLLPAFNQPVNPPPINPPHNCAARAYMLLK